MWLSVSTDTFDATEIGGEILMTSNQLRLAEIKENIRHNLAVEQENARTNRANEGIKTRSNELTEMRNINDYNISVGNLRKEFAKLDEEIRHNMKGEELTKAQNVIKQLEATINAAYVPLKQRELDIKQGELDLNTKKYDWQKLRDMPDILQTNLENLEKITKGVDISTIVIDRIKHALTLLDPVVNLIDAIIPQ